jgi:hypothetical protein
MVLSSFLLSVAAFTVEASEAGPRAAIVPNVETKSEDESSSSSPGSSTVPCGIWLAPSTIPGAGLGMYAGKDYVKDEHLQDIGDIVVPIVDIHEHSHQYNETDWTFLWDEYTWDADALHMSTEGIYVVSAASPGFGAAANSFLAIVNVEEWTTTYDTAGLHRSTDPGIGAFSPYYDRKVTAKRDIHSGEEFFVSYGENWFISRPHFGPIPLFHEVDRATRLAKFHHNLQDNGNVPLPILDELWDTFVRNTAFKDSRVLGAFHHDDHDELQQLRSMSLKELRQKQSTRSLEWLEQHGTCGDHIAGKTSTIPQAGHGGFASRFLPVGTVVSQLPLIHVTDRNRFTMYNLATKKGERHPKREKGVLGHQLLVGSEN